MKNKGWKGASVIGQWRNSPVSEQICLSFSSWQGNFVLVIAPPSSPKLLLISAFQFPPFGKHWVLTYFRLSLWRERAEMRNCWDLVQSCFRFSQGVGMLIQREKYARKVMLWLRSIPHDLNISMFGKGLPTEGISSPVSPNLKALSAKSKSD